MAVSPENALQTLGKWIQVTGLQLVCDLKKSKDAYLHDALSGSDFLDFFGFFASRPLGFNHPGMIDADFVTRLGQVALTKTSNCDVYTTEYAEFTDTFATTALEEKFAHVFFIEGGAPAVENALKTAIDWKHRKNAAAGRAEKGKQIIHFQQAFHGRTGYALSLTDSFDPRKTDCFPLFDWPRIDNPVMRFPFDDAARAAVEEAEKASLAQIDAAFDANPDDIAAIIIEPIQGEGGDNYFRSEFLQALRKVCDEREALLIFDEIQTGFGGTGEWWDYKHHGVQPDLLVFGKKTQVCGFAAAARVDEVESVFKVPSRISSTFEGNLVDMVRCQRVIEIIESENLVANAATMGRYTIKLLEELAEQHPEMSQVRGRGTWSAFNLPSTEDRNAVVRACFEEELLILPAGTHSIRLRPALDVGADAIGRCAAQLEAGLQRAYGKGR